MNHCQHGAQCVSNIYHTDCGGGKPPDRWKPEQLPQVINPKDVLDFPTTCGDKNNDGSFDLGMMPWHYEASTSSWSGPQLLEFNLNV